MFDLNPSNPLKELKEKLSEKLSESELDEKLFYLVYAVAPELTKLIDRKKKIAVGSSKGGSGKSKTACDIAYTITERKKKKTILTDDDFGGPNDFRRMEGLINFDFNKLRSLTGEEAVDYFRKNAPITPNAKETLISWYEQGALKRLNLPHFLMYRDTIGNNLYKKKIRIEDLLVDAGENLKIIFGLLDTYTYPLLGTTDRQIKNMVSSVFSLPADKIIADTAPGINHGSLYIFSEADIRYVIANLEIASTEEPMGFVESSIAYILQKKIGELSSLHGKKEEVNERFNKQLEIYRKNTDELCKEKIKIRSDNINKYIKEKFIDNHSMLDINSFALIKEVIEYSKVVYERDQLPESIDERVMGELQEDAPKLNKFEDLRIGMSLFDFLQKHGKHDFIKKILEDFGNSTYFVMNNIPHDRGEAAEKLLSYIVKNYFPNRYGLNIRTVEGVPFVYSLDESIMSKATNQGVPSLHYLVSLKKFDSSITREYYAQLKKLIKPLVM